MGTQVAKQEKAAVPDLVRTPAFEITAEDVALPRLYIGQYMSNHVQEKIVAAGDIYVATGADDPEPEVLYDGKGDGALVHVLSLKKGKSASVDGELELFDFDDPNAPEDAWVTYNYVIALPEYDYEVPAKWLLTRTGRPTAQRINTVLKKNEARLPAYANAFRVTTAERKNEKGKFFVPQLRHVEANEDDVKIAEALAIMVSGNTAEATSRGEEPAI